MSCGHVHIPRLVERAWENPVGEPGWLSVTDIEGKPAHPMIRCNCGKHLGIGAHTVHEDGRITMSFLHAAPSPDPCGWHVMLALDGWAGGLILPRQAPPNGA